jgi:serpin B
MTHITPVASALAAAIALAGPLFALAADSKAPRTPEDAAQGAWVAEANNSFAADLHGKLAGQAGNLFYSPSSIETALAMTAAGARGRTAEQMLRVLHLGTGRADLHHAMGAFLRSLNIETGPDGSPRQYRLSVANALWGQKGLEFLPDYLRLVKDNYGAGLSQVDFLKDAAAARATINAWVERETRDKIKNLIAEGVLDSRTRLVLTNAIYFKGKWAKPFKTSMTLEEPFHLAGGGEAKASMMHSRDDYGYKETTDYQAIKLPYAGEELSMVVILPKKVDGLAALEKGVTPTLLGKELQRFGREEVVLTLPKFKMTREFELSKVLGAMGMPDAFSAAAADFSGMDGKKDLFISAVVHKAFVDVNEEGTEAAAATGVVGVTSAAIPVVKPPVEFKADHPFLFVIRHEKSGAILFFGRVADPTRES